MSGSTLASPFASTGAVIAYALFAWWFATGIILYLDRLPPRTFRWSMLGASVVAAGGLWGLSASAADASASGAYMAFTAALALWGWQEISFYMGWVTGPRRVAGDTVPGTWRHFRHALETTVWHELSIVLSFGLVVWLTWGQPNQTGTWTFLTLWLMHESARLNVFLGVRNLNAHFLPEHLAYLRHYLTQRPLNLLFPVSVTVSTVVAAWVIGRALEAGAGSFEAVSATFVATMLVLAILEHWFLVLPIPAERLWNWILSLRGLPLSPEAAMPAATARDHASFPEGDGKIRRLPARETSKTGVHAPPVRGLHVVGE